MAEKLLSLDIPTPRAICAIRERRGLFVICDYLATVALPEKSTVFLNRIIDFDRSEQSCLLTEIARLLLRLNRNHICHGDASLRNFFFDKEQKRVGTIDLDGCKMLFPLQKKRSLICEAARAISSFMLCTQDVSEDNYKFASQIFSGVCGKDLLPEKELKRATDIFLKKTRNHYFKAS
jgi:tRNA A-37 threonylcarbamoyl transferase component Bud32